MPVPPILAVYRGGRLNARISSVNDFLLCNQLDLIERVLTFLKVSMLIRSDNASFREDSLVSAFAGSIYRGEVG